MSLVTQSCGEHASVCPPTPAALTITTVCIYRRQYEKSESEGDGPTKNRNPAAQHTVETKLSFQSGKQRGQCDCYNADEYYRRKRARWFDIIWRLRSRKLCHNAAARKRRCCAGRIETQNARASFARCVATAGPAQISDFRSRMASGCGLMADCVHRQNIPLR
jgi:hypothetical protein